MRWNAMSISWLQRNWHIRCKDAKGIAVSVYASRLRAASPLSWADIGLTICTGLVTL